MQLNDPGRTVSRNHARIQALNDEYLLEDLESKNFTFVNKKQVAVGKSWKLKNGDTISVGDFDLKVLIGAAVEKEIEPKVATSAPPKRNAPRSKPAKKPIRPQTSKKAVAPIKAAKPELFKSTDESKRSKSGAKKDLFKSVEEPEPYEPPAEPEPYIPPVAPKASRPVVEPEPYQPPVKSEARKLPVEPATIEPPVEPETFQPIEEPEPYEPPVEPESSNPFDAPISQIFQALQQVCDIYDHQDARSRGNQLALAIQHASPAEDEHIAMKIFALSFSPAADLPPAESQPSVRKRAEPSPPKPSRSGSDTSRRAVQIVETLLPLISDMVRIPQEFHEQFVSQGSDEKEVDAALSSILGGNKEFSPGYLLNPSCSDAEAKRKLAEFKKAGERVIEHQAGMWEGYKAVVQEVLQLALREVDPTLLEQNVLEGNAGFKLFPVLRSNKVLSDLKDNIAQMQKMDWSLIEQRVYRPAFVRAYLTAIGEDVPKTNGSPNKKASKQAAYSMKGVGQKM